MIIFINKTVQNFVKITLRIERFAHKRKVVSLFLRDGVCYTVSARDIIRSNYPQIIHIHIHKVGGVAQW